MFAEYLDGLQDIAVADMSLTLAVYEPAGTTTDADGYEVLAYTSRGSTFGKVQGSSQSTRDAATRYVTIGAVKRPVLESGLHIPIDALVPVAGEQRGIGWEYEVTGLGSADDPALFGCRYLVVAVPAKSYATARRLDVVEV